MGLQFRIIWKGLSYETFDRILSNLILDTQDIHSAFYKVYSPKGVNQLFFSIPSMSSLIVGVFLLHPFLDATIERDWERSLLSF